jgi:hypothetical protein
MELIQIFAEFIGDTHGVEIKRFGEGLIHGSFLVCIKNEPEFVVICNGLPDPLINILPVTILLPIIVLEPLM